MTMLGLWIPVEDNLYQTDGPEIITVVGRQLTLVANSQPATAALPHGLSLCAMTMVENQDMQIIADLRQRVVEITKAYDLLHESIVQQAKYIKRLEDLRRGIDALREMEE